MIERWLVARFVSPLRVNNSEFSLPQVSYVVVASDPAGPVNKKTIR